MAGAQRRVTVEGADQLAAAMRDGRRQVTDLSAAHEHARAGLESDARSRAPVLTGQLAGSVWAHASARRLSVGAGAPYAAVIEYGSSARGLPARPFLAPARDAAAGAVLRGYTDRVHEVLRDIASSSPR